MKKEKHTSFFSFNFNTTIIRLGFCDIRNNLGLGKGYQLNPKVSVDNPYLNLDYSGYHKNLILLLFNIGNQEFKNSSKPKLTSHDSDGELPK